MTDLEKIGKQIASLRKERGYTGEKLAELLNVSPQAISKWENAKCLPETAILPALAKALDCSIDNLLLPKELFILEAVYTDGMTHVPVTEFINRLVRDNTLNIYVNPLFVGAALDSDRLKVLTIKYRTPDGIYFTYALQNESLLLNHNSSHFHCDETFRIVDAYYGNQKEYLPAMQKMEHYEYFKWDQIAVNHETFPSNTASDDVEYLTLIYLNSTGIHVISCAENTVIYYGNHHTELHLQDDSKCILPGITKLSWNQGMECPWAGSLYAALKYMGENYTYDQIMGMSGACYRICFTEVWDYSCTDALVSFDYATPLYKAIGYSFRDANRLEKDARKAERLSIMEDIQNGKPVLAINLRIAPEWGVITGYLDNGRQFLCRTYFDNDIFDGWERIDGQDDVDKKITFEERGGYLVNDFWPFLITHFGEKKDKPLASEILKASLMTFVDSFYAGECGGYHQGKEAYEAWIKGLSKESDFFLGGDRGNVLRRLSVNDNMLFHLIDSRRAAASYLRENVSLLPEEGQTLLSKMAENCQRISEMVSDFRNRVENMSSCEIAHNTVDATGGSTPELRREQIRLLEQALILDQENCKLASLILESM